MTLLEKSSQRKCKALKKLVEIQEYSLPYALEKLENYHDTGRILDNDYEELAEYLESLLEPVEEVPAEEETDSLF